MNFIARKMKFQFHGRSFPATMDVIVVELEQADHHERAHQFVAHRFGGEVMSGHAVGVIRHSS